ncbi:MAG TPA: tetratricopeptide repeat protein [Rhizomicrobium sp.]|nr:tetratricopeptide repeat protein [Rhizomicrobium sp.]
MIDPATEKRIREKLKLCREDPGRYLDMANARIRHNPRDPDGYFDRHRAWLQLEKPDQAIQDLDRVVEMDPHPLNLYVRGRVHRDLGNYDRALADFERGESLAPGEWRDLVLGLFYQADCHARLGHEAEALACCARLPDDFWSPGPHGTTAGNKDEIADGLRRIAAAAGQ